MIGATFRAKRTALAFNLATALCRTSASLGFRQQPRTVCPASWNPARAVAPRNLIISYSYSEFSLLFYLRKVCSPLPGLPVGATGGAHMMATRPINISTDVYAAIWSDRKPGEDSEEQILRRKFGVAETQ